MLKPLILALALTAVAGAAQAADPATDDMRCIMVVGILGGTTTNPTMCDGAMMGLGYYIGRLKGRDPSFDLTGRLTALAKGMKIADLTPDFTRCGEEMKAIGLESQEVGRALQNMAKAGSPT